MTIERDHTQPLLHHTFDDVEPTEQHQQFAIDMCKLNSDEFVHELLQDDKGTVTPEIYYAALEAYAGLQIYMMNHQLKGYQGLIATPVQKNAPGNGNKLSEMTNRLVREILPLMKPENQGNKVAEMKVGMLVLTRAASYNAISNAHKILHDKGFENASYLLDSFKYGMEHKEKSVIEAQYDYAESLQRMDQVFNPPKYETSNAEEHERQRQAVLKLRDKTNPAA